MNPALSRRRVLRTLASFGAIASLGSLTQAAPANDLGVESATALLAVLREAAGQDKPDDALEPWGWFDAVLPDGRRVQMAPSWYRYLGDMQLRLVFDAGTQLQSAEPADLERLRLTPEDALDLAVANLRRRYGAPVVTDWGDGVSQVQGDAPELASSYFMDRAFWAGVEAENPQGVVVAVPRRGGLVFAPAQDTDAVARLRFAAAALYGGAGGTRVSNALYLFRGGRWQVWQPPRRVAAIIR